MGSIGPAVSEEKMFKEKVDARQTDGQTDRRTDVRWTNQYISSADLRSQRSQKYIIGTNYYVAVLSPDRKVTGAPPVPKWLPPVAKNPKLRNFLAM